MSDQKRGGSITSHWGQIGIGISESGQVCIAYAAYFCPNHFHESKDRGIPELPALVGRCKGADSFSNLTNPTKARPISMGTTVGRSTAVRELF